MKLTPQAQRLVAGLMQSHPDAQARARWSSWENRSAGEDLPADILLAVIDALAMAAREIETSLDAGGLDEDRESDLVNDLGYIQAIGSDLKKEATRLRRAHVP
jgi:hypothetical protein